MATYMELPSYLVRFDFYKVDYRIKKKKKAYFVLCLEVAY